MAEHAEGGRNSAAEGSEAAQLIVAEFQEDQKPLVCVEHPGTRLKRIAASVLIMVCSSMASQLLCVSLFLGIVQDDAKALASLGGIGALSKVCQVHLILNPKCPSAPSYLPFLTSPKAYFHKYHHLELKLRPEDAYCRPAVAREKKVTNLILRVKRKKREGGHSSGASHPSSSTVEQKDEDGERSGGHGYCAEVLGLVNTSFEFPGKYSVLIWSH